VRSRSPFFVGSANTVRITVSVYRIHKLSIDKRLFFGDSVLRFQRRTTLCFNLPEGGEFGVLSKLSRNWELYIESNYEPNKIGIDLDLHNDHFDGRPILCQP